MMELIEYIKWRGDLTFDERALNEVDSILFCAFVYERFDPIFEKHRELTINQLVDYYFEMYDEEQLKKRITLANRSYEIVKAMKNTKRYGDLIVSHFVNEIDRSQDLQLAAMCFEYKNKWKYIAFRGTDDHIVGWKEDFNMIYKKEVLAQRKAVEYLQAVIKEESRFKRWFQPYGYYIGGHSKGGNLAMYAASELNKELQNKIIRIDNFDGPGFLKHVWEKEGMKNIISKIYSFIPTSSFFGRLFEHHETVKIIQSSAKGLVQHAMFGWKVDVDCLKAESKLSESSDKAYIRLHEILNELNEEEKKHFVDALFMIFERLGIDTIADMVDVNPTKIIKAIMEIKNLEGHYRKIMIEVLMLIVSL